MHTQISNVLTSEPLKRGRKSVFARGRQKEGVGSLQGHAMQHDKGEQQLLDNKKIVRLQ